MFFNQISSYNTHEFSIKFANSLSTAEVRFAKGPTDETVYVHYSKENKFLTVQQTTVLDDMIAKVNNAAGACKHFKDEDEFLTCFGGGMENDVEKLIASKSKLVRIREAMSQRLRNYTCIDHDMNTSKPLRTEIENINGKSYEVNVYFESYRARIWTIPNFVTDEECDHLESFAKPKLKRATVADSTGKSIVSENRKASQAGYHDFNLSNPEEPLLPLQSRVLSHINSMTGYGLRPEGQENFVVIQYNATDQYTPHCDGQCDGLKYNLGGRVATSVLYCKVADKGGATTFTNADVFIKPEKGMATFFSYVGPDGMTDDGFTEHSGCPVVEGEKWITTFWMRRGVSLEKPWGLLDPKGVPILIDDE